ncbi:TetR/AcrR family transcriptional regulator [Mesorhizobium sp. LHD-90]|uniref:TetR/AcrR family transcriptional regulator n=1 Tax=Mesorhizobium sp. LHD-90 TaxID=3071414 RepID=UPI0027DEFDD8|nr:TetR/AcrR family transcriptional regulator [Mesorhizobium sp. LHD-90]MDQ6438215.1 TetR/AcrR family transcriptional regulator [Mesorhizobium sp. LHD-90]
MSNGAATRIDRSRKKIIGAAEQVFLQHGFLGTNMDAVAEKAGVSKQTVYAHFKSKEALFVEVVRAMTGVAAHEIGEDVDEVLDDRPVRDYLLEVAIDQLRIVLTPRLMQLRRMVIGEVERFPDLGRSLYENGPMRSIRRLTRALEHYSSIGQIKTPDPSVAATQFNWLVMGAPTNAAMFLGDGGIPPKAQLRAHARECVRIFLCGYAAEGAAGS